MLHIKSGGKPFNMLCAKQQIVNLKCMNYAEKVLTLYVTDPLHNTGSYLLVQFTNDFFPLRGRLKEKLYRIILYPT